MKTKIKQKISITLDEETLKLIENALKSQDLKIAPKPWEGKNFVFETRRKKLKGAGMDISKSANPTDAMKEMTSKRFA